MPITPISLTDSIDSLWTTTMRNYKKTLVDNFFRKQVLLYLLDKKGRKVYESGGYQIVVPGIFSDNPNVGSFSKYDVVATDPSDEFLPGIFDWKFVSGAVTISTEELLKNSGDSAIVNLLESKIEALERTIRKAINTMLFSDGTGNSSKDLDGLKLLVDSTPTVGTYGGINRATYTGWQNYAKASAGSFATNGKTEMLNAWVQVADGDEIPDVCITDPTTWSYYHQSVQEHLRLVDSKLNDVGFTNLAFMNTPVTFDRLCDAGFMYFLNTDYIKFYVHKDGDFKTEPFIPAIKQHAKTSKTLFCGNLIATKMVCHGVITGFTA